MNPYYQDDHVTVHAGDCLDVMAELPDASVDAVVTDPPYGLEFMGKEWDRPWAVTPAATTGFTGRGDNFTLPSHRDSRNANCRTCGGRQRGAKRCECASPAWDRDPASDMREFQAWCTTWATECLRVLKPGGHMLTFGGTRTYHRLACAVEDAGFEIRDSIAWLYGSGFPKSLDVSKAIDKGHRRDYVAAALRLGMSIPGRNLDDWTKEDHAPGDKWWVKFREHLPEDDWARLEREVVGSGTSGAADIAYRRDNASSYDVTSAATDLAKQWQGWGTALKPAFEPIVVGRKPLRGTVAANVVEHGTGALNINACRVEAGQDYRDKCASVVGLDSNRNGSAYGEWSGTRTDSASPAGRWPTNVVIDEHTAAGIDAQSGITRDGTAVNRNREAGEWSKNAIYHARNNHIADDVSYGGQGGASRFFPTFRYEAKAGTAERPNVGGIAHPTVKPVDLMRWLVRLVTPPGGVVLDPFAGSGTTAEACIHEHLRCITIEREPDYLPLIVARLSKPMEIGFNFGEGA